MAISDEIKHIDNRLSAITNQINAIIERIELLEKYDQRNMKSFLKIQHELTHLKTCDCRKQKVLHPYKPKWKQYLPPEIGSEWIQKKENKNNNRRHIIIRAIDHDVVLATPLYKTPRKSVSMSLVSLGKNYVPVEVFNGYY